MNTAVNYEPISAERLEFDLVDRLRKALRVAGITAGELAVDIDVARSTVNNWINGHTKPRRRDLMAVAAVTGVPAVWLATGELPAIPASESEPTTGIETLADDSARADYGIRTRDLFFSSWAKPAKPAPYFAFQSCKDKVLA